VPGRKHIGWPNSETLINNLGDNSYLAYRTGSSALHSQWADLIRNHLARTDDDHFEPNFDELPPRPQPLYAGAVLLARTMNIYLAKVRPEALEPFRAHLDGLEGRLDRLVQMHGAWLDAQRAD
jgi:hypothetical protein